MRRLFSYVLILLTAVLILAGCGGGGETAVSEPEAPPVAAEPKVEAVADAEEAEVAAEHDKYNLSLIGNTGRPQFLNAYASW